MALEELEGLDAIGRLEGVVSGVAKRPDEEGANGGLVVDDEDRTVGGLKRWARLGHTACPSITRRTARLSVSALNGFGRKATPWSGTP